MFNLFFKDDGNAFPQNRTSPKTGPKLLHALTQFTARWWVRYHFQNHVHMHSHICIRPHIHTCEIATQCELSLWKVTFLESAFGACSAQKLLPTLPKFLLSLDDLA